MHLLGTSVNRRKKEGRVWYVYPSGRPGAALSAYSQNQGAD
jgi:hypothetical protein